MNKVWTSAGKLLIMMFLGSLNVAMAGECDRMITPLASAENYRGQKTLVLDFHRPPNCNDHMNIMLAVPPSSWHQIELDNSGNGSCVPYSGACRYYGLNANANKPYLFKIQSCRTRTLASSVCSPWSGVAHYLPYGPDTCQDGDVWREASASDRVCVSPSSRDQARNDNVQARSRINGTNHSFGPDTCAQGFVWREAFLNDHVCVTTAVRAQTKAENNDAGKHYARNWN